MKNCPVCNNKLDNKLEVLMLPTKEKLFKKENINKLICNQCGLKIINEPINIDEILKQRLKKLK